jgi:transcriptional regulator with XRE-family HTH domain
MRRLRKDRGLSQAQLAELAGVEQGTVSKIEVGSRRGDPETLRKIAAALGVSVEELGEPAPRDALPADSRPTMAAVPGWSDVLDEAKQLAPGVKPEAWELLERSPGLLSTDLPLTPTVVADLGKLVQRHMPLRKT